MKKMVIAVGLTCLPAAAIASELPGVWSLAATKNCEAGPAWVFFADGYYAEVTLPSSDAHALGIWRDEGKAIAYTHTHMPFAGNDKPMEVKRLTVDDRAAERIATKNYRGLPRIFHRCPASALKARSGQPAH